MLRDLKAPEGSFTITANIKKALYLFIIVAFFFSFYKTLQPGGSCFSEGKKQSGSHQRGSQKKAVLQAAERIPYKRISYNRKGTVTANYFLCQNTLPILSFYKKT